MNSYNQRDFANYTVVDSTPISSGAISKKFMASVFAWMFIALGVSALAAVLFSSTPSFASLMYQQTPRGLTLNGFGQIVRFFPLVFGFTMIFAIRRLSAPLLTLFFILFAISMGMSFSSFLLIFTTNSILGCFATTSVMFGVMAVMGYTTDKDLTSFGSILTMALVGMIVAIMINWFMQSEALSYIISLVGVAVFTGFTAYDVQRLKRIGAGVEFDGISANDTRKLALMGALSLYLNFVNLFIYLLNLFGNRRN